MEIKKILNNNAVIVICNDGKDKIILEKGLGFNHKVGDKINENQNQQVFILSDEFYQKYINLTKNIDSEILDVSETVIQYGKQILRTPLNEFIHLTVPDHIAGVVNRYKNKQELTNSLTLEISRLFDKEFLIGQYACKLMNDKLNLQVTDDEATFIAMHFVNAQIERREEIQTTLSFIRDIIKIVETFFSRHYDINSFSYYRFIMHLRGLISRIYLNKPFNTDDNLYTTISNSYPQSAQCVEKVVKMISLKYKKDVSTEEKAYLILYIEKLNREF